MTLSKEKKEIDFSRIPRHVAFIMDGNGRWAKKRGMPRTYGHRIGIDSFRSILKRANELGIKVVSFFAFSTENWKRPKSEINEIFNLVGIYLDKYREKFIHNNFKLMVIGDIYAFPKKLVQKVLSLIKDTSHNSGMIVNIALSYGGKREIVEAVNKIIREGIRRVNEKSFKRYLETASIPDPDFVIRTGGEKRLSNFMLYQLSYSELYFVDTYWPDFRAKELDKAIIEFQSRDRRFGKIEK